MKLYGTQIDVFPLNHSVAWNAWPFTQMTNDSSLSGEALSRKRILDSLQWRVSQRMTNRFKLVGALSVVKQRLLSKIFPNGYTVNIGSPRMLGAQTAHRIADIDGDRCLLLPSAFTLVAQMASV